MHRWLWLGTGERLAVAGHWSKSLPWVNIEDGRFGVR